MVRLAAVYPFVQDTIQRAWQEADLNLVLKVEQNYHGGQVFRGITVSAEMKPASPCPHLFEIPGLCATLQVSGYECMII
jgi:hypothetical protein